MEGKDKLFLMLEEYRALRAEELALTRFQYQLYALAVAIGMGLATAGAVAHRPTFFLYLIVGTALLGGLPIAFLQYEIAGSRKRLREIEYEVNTRTSDRIFARENDRALSIRTDWADRERRRRMWRRFVAQNMATAERWRTGARQFRETIRGRPRRPSSFHTDGPPNSR